jgi:hypothetical protein
MRASPPHSSSNSDHLKADTISHKDSRATISNHQDVANAVRHRITDVLNTEVNPIREVGVEPTTNLELIRIVENELVPNPSHSFKGFSNFIPRGMGFCEIPKRVMSHKRPTRSSRGHCWKNTGFVKEF